MNFIFISPQFPKHYWNFCDRLKKNGVNVLGIGDSPYDALSDELKNALTEYYYLPHLDDYGEMVKAVGFFTFKYGKIDWIESNNEFWLAQDARLRTDFHVTTGEQYDHIDRIKNKSAMKAYYAKAGVPTARLHKVTSFEAGRDFAHMVGYPVIVKPDNGVGACDTYKLHNDDELAYFYATKPQDVPYVMEEFINGQIFSYDAILDSHSEPLFESTTAWPPSIMDIVLKQLDLAYYTAATVPEALRRAGRATVKAFGVCSRFVHLEFFCLAEDKEPRQEGGLRRPRGQHAPRGRLHAGHDELRALDGCLPDLGRHGHDGPPHPAGFRPALLLCLRRPPRLLPLCAQPRGSHAALRREHGHVRAHAGDDGPADGQPDVHGQAAEPAGDGGVHPLRPAAVLSTTHLYEILTSTQQSIPAERVQ